MNERSRPHRRVEKVLEAMGVNYISEHPVGVYSLDCYLPEWHLCIEIDGPYHMKKHDRKRDEDLRSVGIETLRIKVANKYWNQEAIRAVVLEFIELHADTTKERKYVRQPA